MSKEELRLELKRMELKVEEQKIAIRKLKKKVELKKEKIKTLLVFKGKARAKIDAFVSMSADFNKDLQSIEKEFGKSELN